MQDLRQLCPLPAPGVPFIRAGDPAGWQPSGPPVQSPLPTAPEQGSREGPHTPALPGLGIKPSPLASGRGQP